MLRTLTNRLFDSTVAMLVAGSFLFSIVYNVIGA